MRPRLEKSGFSSRSGPRALKSGRRPPRPTLPQAGLRSEKRKGNGQVHTSQELGYGSMIVQARFVFKATNKASNAARRQKRAQTGFPQIQATPNEQANDHMQVNRLP